MGRIVVGVGEMGVSNRAGDRLITHSLGSCLGIAIHDPLALVGGLLHIMLPDSTLNPQMADRYPCMFANTGLCNLFNTVRDLGARRQRLKVVLVGGARVIAGKNSFHIGERNYRAVRRILWRNNILVSAEEVGGTAARTMDLNMADGEVTVLINAERTKKL